MTKNILILLLILFGSSANSQSFNSIWNTANISSGSSANNEITIPTNPAFTTYNYTVDWGDTTTDTNVTGDITHTYSTPGTYTISISGDFPAIYFNNKGDRLKIIEILDWGTIQWQSMENAFYGCYNLNFDAIGSPDLSQVTTLQYMFRDARRFNGIINNWDVTNVTDITGMFWGASIFNRPLDSWTTNGITEMDFTFSGAGLFNEPLDNWNTTAVTTMEALFSGAARFNQDINNWNVANVTNMSRTFEGTRAFNRPLNNWVVNKVTDMTGMFSSSAFNQPIGNWSVDKVTNMSEMFRSASFNQSIGGWNVSAVTNMARMFERNSVFNQPLNNWTVGNVTDMSSMFDGGSGSLSKFDQPLDLWDVSSVTDMSGMFAVTEFNQPIGNWDVSAVTDMSRMFEGWATRYTLFDQPINGWNVVNVTNMRGMFRSSNFNQPLAGWTVSSVTNMGQMFQRAQNFDRPLGSWSVDAVTSLTDMFSGAPNFDQDISAWNISNVTDMTRMLNDCGLSEANYDAALIAWAQLSVNDNVNLGARQVRYCDGRDARQELIDDHNWSFTGDQINCSYVLCADIISPVANDQNVPNNFALVWETVNGATGYRVSARREVGATSQVIADDLDVGNVTQLDFIGDFNAGDTVFMKVVPYNATGPATGCQEISVGIIQNWRSSPDAYILTYDTRINGIFASGPNLLELETNSQFTYDFNIDWGDNQYDNNVKGDITHRYRNPGIYTVAIIGTYPAPYHSVFGDGTKLLSVDQFGTQEWLSMSQAFYRAESMTFNSPGTPNLSKVTNMYGTFYSAKKFNTNINHWDVSKVTNMSLMFGVADEFNQPLDNWDVSKVTNMRLMFFGTKDFDQPINSWEVDLVEDMSGMFRGAEAFDQPLSTWITSNVTNMSEMFGSTKSFNQNLNSWNVGAVTDMEEMFKGAEVFNRPIDSWNVSEVTTMEGMFEGALVFNRPLNSWNVGKVRNMMNMFKDAEAFNETINDWNVSAVENMTRMFQSALIFNQPLNLWNVGNVNSMPFMFNNATAFNQNIDPWNVTKVTNMMSMFHGASAYNQPMASWDVNSVVNMQSMFESAEAFDQPLNAWDVSAVANTSSMFKNAILFDEPLQGWDVSSVTLMNSMFEKAEVFNRNLDTWDVGSVTRMDAMFKDAANFNQLVGSWDTGEVVTMEEMFHGASKFNRPIGNWNVSFVSNMEKMFKDAVAFDQPINAWNVASVTTMEDMFNNAGTFNQDIDGWNVRNVTTMENMFNAATAFNQSIDSWRVVGVSTMEGMFQNASSYDQHMDGWNLGTTNMRSFLQDATAFNQSLESWDVSGITDMRNMLDNTAIERINYDNTLIAWSKQTLRSGITFGALSLPYCEAEEERQSMIDTYGWNIVGDIRDCPIPLCTQLTSPLNGATDVPVNANITWESVLYAKGYRLIVGTTAGGNDVVNNVTVTDTFYEFVSDFNTGDVVYVTLIPFNDEGDAVGPCTEESFTISNDPATIPDCTNLTEPLNGANDILVTTDLTWGPISNADGYKLTIGTSVGASDILNGVDVGNVTTYDLATDLPEDSTIYVTIIPYNHEGDATGCTKESFETELIPVPPVCTSLTDPLNNATDVPIDTPLSWTAVSNATGYLVIVGTTSGGIETVNNIDVGPATTYDIPDDLLENRLYYVTIIPYNNEGDATGCTEETFRTGDSTSPPSCTSLTAPTNSATAVSPATNLTWTTLTKATGYKLSVGTSTRATDIFTGDVGNLNTHDLAADLPESTIIYVTVTPYNINGDAVGCTEETFTTDGPPLCTTLNSPSNNDTDVAFDLSNITWNASTNADGYKLTILASSSTANNETDLDITTGTTHNFANDFERGETVTVTIVPYNSVGDATGPCTSESFTIIPPPVPLCTTLITPADGAINVAVDTGLEWIASTGADGYKLTVLASSSTANNVTDLDIPSGTTHTFTNDFEQGETVEVTIVPYNGEGDAIGCTAEIFTIKPVPSCTTLIIPGDAAVDVAVDTDISWTVVPDATGYKLSVSGSSSTANNSTDEQITTGNTYDFSDNFDQGETVTVTIVPYNEVGDAIGCAPESFTIKPVPSCTNLTAPANGDVDVPVDTDITWNAIADANGYKLTVTASGSTANNETDLDIPSGTTHTFMNDFKHGETVSITVVPYNEVGDAIGCSSESFTIVPTPCSTLITPNDLDINVAVNTNLEWNTSTDANGYLLTVMASNSTANNETNLDITSGTTHTFTNDFEQGETVSVTIVPYNEFGNAIGCSTERFTIKPVPSCTNLIIPGDGAVDVAVDTDISWTVVPDATGYKLSVSGSSSTANNSTDELITTGNTYDFMNNFDQGETVTVTIVPYNEVGDAIGCTSESFTIKPVPSCTNLTAPANGDIDVPVDTDITWNAIADANGYHVTVNASTSTANNGTFDVTTGNSYDFTNNFEQGETVTVTIVPYNEVGDAIGCTSESFTIKPIPLCTNLTAPADGDIDLPVDTSITWNTVSDANGYRVTVAASNSTANNGTYDVTSGNSYGFTNHFEQSETVTVTITPYNEVGAAIGCSSESFTIKSVPMCTNLAAPGDRAIVAEVNELTWNAISDADGYRLTINATNTTSNNVTDLVVTGTTHVFPNDFNQGEVITVTITPYNEVGDAIGCTSESFTIRPIPLCTKVVASLNGATEVPVATDISWNESFDADGYRISVGTSPNGTDIVNNEDVASLTSYTFSQDLPSETLIYATIIPYNTSGDAVGCTSDSFRTEVIIPKCTALSNPFNGENDVSLESTINWNEVEKTDGYRISIGTTSGGNDIVNNLDIGSATSYRHTEEFPFGKEIYIAIVPYNSKGDAVQCEEQAFTTLVPEDETKYGFSPDGDGINEYWHIENIQYYPENIVTIYNRWGDAVFKIAGYNNTENVFRGEANQMTKIGAGTLPAGTYFFNIQIEGENILKKTKGFLVLKR